MAELDTSSGGGKEKGHKKIRSKKQSTRIDLTAMVDLAFLLITFFMLTTTLAKPQAMDLAMPDKDQKDPDAKFAVKASRTLTILIGKNDKLLWYAGEPGKSPAKLEQYGKNGIRKVLIEQNKRVIDQTKDDKKGLIVLIKPSDKSNYKNFVDILDEMKIIDIATYAVVDITGEEISMLKKENVY